VKGIHLDLSRAAASSCSPQTSSHSSYWTSPPHFPSRYCSFPCSCPVVFFFSFEHEFCTVFELGYPPRDLVHRSCRQHQHACMPRQLPASVGPRWAGWHFEISARPDPSFRQTASLLLPHTPTPYNNVHAYRSPVKRFQDFFMPSFREQPLLSTYPCTDGLASWKVLQGTPTGQCSPRSSSPSLHSMNFPL
jgi:hypothetical protein